uniref:Peptidase M14 domain-containing protein n=1 Tax=Glossina pallidipes TaxID=7398 RepID=A0A1B0AIJ9_GLOPL
MALGVALSSVFTLLSSPPTFRLSQVSSNEQNLYFLPFFAGGQLFLQRPPRRRLRSDLQDVATTVGGFLRNKPAGLFTTLSGFGRYRNVGGDVSVFLHTFDFPGALAAAVTFADIGFDSNGLAGCDAGCDFSAGDFSVGDFAIDFAADCVGWAGWAERGRVFDVSALMGEGETSTVLGDQSFIRNTTWYIMPVLNPDSYVYSHDYDRFWKKSRSLHVSRPTGLINSAMTWLKQKKVKEKICFGVDLDRNWHYQWGRRGSSKSPCNEFFAGPGPFSEPETKAMAEFLLENRSQIKLFISLQAYGQILSYPIKINASYNTERLEDMLDVAMVGIDGLRKKFSKSRYKIDTSNDLIENRSGCSDAFAAYEVGIPFAYTLQLADNGVHGYLLPSAAIESTAADAFEMIISMLDYI